MHRPIACVVAAMVIVIVSTTHVVATEWELSGEQVAPSPLPFQAARMRIVLRWKGSEAFKADSFSAYPWGFISRFRGADSKEFRSIRGVVCDPDRVLDPGTLGAWDARTPLHIRPNEDLAAVVAFAAEWSDKNARVFLTQPGKYDVCVSRIETTPRGDVRVTSDPIAIVVGTPNGDDKVLVETLHRDERLAAALLGTRRAPPEVMRPQLQMIIKSHANSSYANYARFALARLHVNNVMGIEYAPEADRVAAIELLEDIDHKNFAYGDYSLALWRRILKSLFSREEAKVAAELDRLYPDSPVRLEDLAQRVTLEEWKKLNPRAPVNRKAEKPEARPTDDSQKK